MPTTQNKTRYTETLKDGMRFEMLRIQGASFQMGNAEEDAFDQEKPVREVSVPTFYLSPFLVTQALWEAVMGDNSSQFQGGNRPVEQVSWDDCHLFLEKLNQQTKKSYRLPTEAEWEFAARGGSHSEGYLYAGSDKLKQVGWYDENSSDGSMPVGLQMPNELGLYDMSGNLFEWCEDDWHDDYSDAPIDGSAWIDRKVVEKETRPIPKRSWLGKLFKGEEVAAETPVQVFGRGSRRILRGGNWGLVARGCRVSYRHEGGPDGRTDFVGFRLACSPQSARE